MAQTARDTISRAMRMLSILLDGATPTATEAADGLTALNAMMFGWKGQGVDVNHIELALNDNLALPEEFHNAVTALLAVEISSEYQAPIPPLVAAAATNGWDALKATYSFLNNPDSDLICDTGLRRLGNTLRSGWYRP